MGTVPFFKIIGVSRVITLIVTQQNVNPIVFIRQRKLSLLLLIKNALSIERGIYS